MTDAQFYQLKYYKSHKQFKVYLNTEEDAQIIQAIKEQNNRSAFIRKALIHEVNRNSGKPSDNAEKVLVDELDHTLQHLQQKDMDKSFYEELTEFAYALKYALFAIGYMKEKENVEK